MRGLTLAKRVILETEHYVFINDTLYHLYQPRSKGLDRIMPVVEQLCIPRSLREVLLRAYHDDNCHVGHARLYQTLKMKYYFPQMYSDSLRYVKSCHLCQRTKTSTRSRKAP